MATKKVIFQKNVYDPNSGRDVREMKPTRSFYLMNASTAITAANGIVASTIVGYNQNIMITGMSAGLITDNTAGGIPVTVSLLENSSSVTCIALQTGTATAGARSWNNIVTTSDAPILFSIGSGAASGTRTIQLTASSIGTYNASVWGQIQPILSKAEV